MAETLNFQMKFKQAKQGFFDQDLIKGKMDAVTHKRLSEFGAYVMTRSRRSIRDTKKSSLSGQPPRSHVGLLKEGQAAITFHYDDRRQSVIIGPTLTNKSSGAPKRLEYGGTIDVEGKVIYVRNKGRLKKGAERFSRVTLHGKRTIAARPYMHPAFDVELAKHMEKWKDSLR
jgi:hypothetical protein